MSEKQSLTPQGVFFFLCLTPETVAKGFYFSQSLRCKDEEEMPLFLCNPGGSLKHPVLPGLAGAPGAARLSGASDLFQALLAASTL